MAASLMQSSRRLATRGLYNYVPVCQKHKFMTKKPRPQVMERRVFEHVTQPLYPEPLSVLRHSCLDPNAPQNIVEEDNPYELFVIRQLKKLIAQSKMIIICHSLPHSNVRRRDIRITLELKGFKLSIVNNRHLRDIFKDTEKENLNSLLNCDCLMITAPELNMKEMWTIVRKVPELVVLGGFCSDRLVTRDQIIEISKLPPMEILLGQLVASLNQAAGGRTSSLLGSHQQTLSRNLEQYHKQLSEKSS